ncbi:MAG: hypothetical protein CSB13_04000 [Chloroflexi bacterium]|nr:MAG: hypothetical protein CSB13_04000 [Chloroflexota bacterium]
MMHENEELAPLPGVWRTIAAGFDLTTKHLWLLILPVFLDAFLWLGPRLSSRPIWEQMVSMLPPDPALESYMAQFMELAPRTNLFTSLSVPFIGIPVYMIGATPEATPLPVSVIEIADPMIWIAMFLLFSMIGVLLTAVYFTLISQTIRIEENRPTLALTEFIRRVASTWIKLLGLGIILFIFSLIILIPFMIVAFVVALLSQFLAMMVLLISFVLILWLLIFTYFVPHNLSLLGHPLPIAIMSSVQLMRTYLSPTLGLLIIILIIRNFLSSLLLLADNGSWLTGANILGHAFIMTSLTTAAFLFFRDHYVAMAKQNSIYASNQNDNK